MKAIYRQELEDEAYTLLFIGSQVDYEESKIFKTEAVAVVHACKDPYHRLMAKEAYIGGRIDPTHPNYLIKWSDDGRELALNIIDGDDSKYFSIKLFKYAFKFTKENLKFRSVLIHCNQGKSRAPSIGMAYLLSNTEVLPKTSFSEAENKFSEIYPYYAPMNGIRNFIKENFERLVANDI